MLSHAMRQRHVQLNIAKQKTARYIRSYLLINICCEVSVMNELKISSNNNLLTNFRLIIISHAHDKSGLLCSHKDRQTDTQKHTVVYVH